MCSRQVAAVTAAMGRIADAAQSAAQIGSSVVAPLTVTTSTRTDHATSPVAIGRIDSMHAMRPKIIDAALN